MKKIIPDNGVLIPETAKCVFKGEVFDVYQWPQQMFDGTSATFEMLKRPDTAEIIAIKDNKLIVLKEEQPGLPAHYSLPAGRNDVPGEDSLGAAQRELLEETGMVFKTWKLHKVIQPYVKIEWFIYQWIATDFVENKGQDVEVHGEKIVVMEKSLDEVKQLLDDPLNRYVPREVFGELSSFDELIAMPEFKGKEVDH